MKKNILRIKLIVFLLLFLSFNVWGQKGRELIAISGPKGNILLWSGAVLHPSTPSPEGWIGYNLYRALEGEKKFRKVNPAPISRLGSLDEFKKGFGKETSNALMKLLKCKDEQEFWMKIKTGDLTLVKWSFFASELRMALGLAHLDQNIEKGKTYFYYIAKVDKKGKEAPPSPIAKLEFSRLIGPKEVKAEMRGKSVLLTWKPNPEESLVFGYHIYRSTKREGDFVRISKGPVLIGVVEGKEPTGIFYDDNVEEKTYFYYIASTDIAGNESQKRDIVEVSIKDVIPPLIPQDIKATSSRSGILISLGVVPDEDLAGYNLYRSEEWDGKYERINKVLIPPSKNPSYEDFAVLPNKQYFYTVSSVDKSNNESPMSARISGYFENLNPPIPSQNATATPQEKGILIRWSANQESDLRGYIVFRGEEEKGDYVQISPLLPKEKTEFLDEDSYLNPKGTYWYRVKAVNITGIESPLSNPAIASPIDRIPPEPPTGFHGYSEADETRLLWDASIDDTVEGCLIFKKKGEEGEFECIIKDPIPASSPRIYIDKAVKPGGTYSYFLVSVDQAGNRSKPTLTISISMPNPLPPPPSNFRVSSTEKGILLNWDRIYVENASGYHIYRKASSGEYKRITKDILSLETKSFLDDSVEENVQYSYYIVSVSLNGSEGEKSRDIGITYRRF